MSKEARSRKAAYMQAYRQKNREQINATAREWRRRNPEKVLANVERYWERVVEREREAAEHGQKQN